MAKLEEMPPADLTPHERDVHLPNEQFLELSLFAPLKNKPNLAKFPGTLVVRRFRKGEVICRQGEAGWTAFYLLTSNDALTLCRHQLAAATDGRPKAALEADVEVLSRRVERLKDLPPDAEERTAAMVYLAVAQGPAGKAAEGKAPFIPIDGPVTLRYDSLQAPLHEGDLFGEMSCLYRAPRSATIVATRDCYVVEMLRHILDQLMKDKGYKERADKLYKKRVLELHVRKLSIFEDLTDTQYNEIHDSVELLSVEPGTLVCDEHEHSDSLYIVRSGLVKVMKNVSSLVAADDVKDWAGLCARLRQGDAPAGGAAPPKAAAKLWQLLPAPVQTLLRSDPAGLDDVRKADILYGLNTVLGKQDLGDAPEFQEPAASPAARQFAEGKPAKKKDWAALDARRYNRLLLEALVPEEVLERVHKRDGQDFILNYCARGDYFGEMGLIRRKPRSATCVAYGHPNDYGLVELVRLPEATVHKLIDESPELRAKVNREIQQRQEYMAERGRNLIDDTREVQKSERFERLGLIQGQKLMLIDLDRCTRCDECVRACVATHDDGHSRLFLDGPRFGKYLVPTTCRSCLDPVCMITCPVGSIHRGHNRQIVIEDWCIGCQQCAKNCPYGSIQMHDLGIIPEDARGWRFLPAAAVAGDAWLRPGYRDAAWQEGAGPFHLDRELRDQLAARRPRGAAADGPINFRFAFDLPPGLLRKAEQFRLELTSLSPWVRVWLNGHELTPDDPKPRRDGSRAYTLPPIASEAARRHPVAPTGASADRPEPPAAPPARAGTVTGAQLPQPVASEVPTRDAVTPTGASVDRPEPPTAPPTRAGALMDAPVPLPSGAASITVPGFEVLGVLGEGGMGVVYKARQVGLNRLVALKMIRREYATHTQTLARFRREAEAVARLHHPHIVAVHAWGEHDGAPYIVLEFCTGGSLEDRLKEPLQHPLQAARLVEKLARAVQCAHDAGIIHRDLKPANVLLMPAGDEPVLTTPWGIPKVADFGLCRTFEADVHRTAEGSMAGSPLYMAPEQAEGRMKDIGPATDVWALGVILYELLAGRRPFKGASVPAILHAVCYDEPPRPGELRPGVPSELEDICLRCLRKRPENRFARAVDLVDALRAFLAEPVGPGNVEIIAPPRRPTPAAGKKDVSALRPGAGHLQVADVGPAAGKEAVPALRAAALLRQSGNVIAVQVAPTAKSADVLLRVRLDEVRRPELPADVDPKAAAEISQKLVTERAVVCDLCSTLSHKKPACVQACPHDAALRVDARFEFPTR